MLVRAIIYLCSHFAAKLLAASVAKDGLGLSSPASPYFAIPLPHHRALLTCLAYARAPVLAKEVEAIFSAKKDALAYVFLELTLLVLCGHLTCVTAQ